MKIEREKKNLSPTDGDHTKHLFLYTHSRRKRMNDIRQVIRRSCQSKDPYTGEYLLKRIEMNDQKFIFNHKLSMKFTSHFLKKILNTTKTIWTKSEIFIQ